MGRTKHVTGRGKGGKGLRKTTATTAAHKLTPPPSTPLKTGASLTFSSKTPASSLVSSVASTTSPMPSHGKGITSHVSNVRAHFTNTQSQMLRLPLHWVDMNGENKIMVNIDQNEDCLKKMEWENVQLKFDKTLSNRTIISIHRLQNKFVWESYSLRKRKMEDMYGKGGINELSLFHGTTPSSLDVITEQNLDPRLAGNRTGTMLGKGTYFAVNASYSDGYAKPDDAGHKYMFLCKVLAGNSCAGKHDYTRPPPQFPGGPLFDSCYNNDSSPTIYCIYHDSQYYPEYLIEYI